MYEVLNCAIRSRTKKLSLRGTVMWKELLLTKKMKTEVGFYFLATTLQCMRTCSRWKKTSISAKINVQKHSPRLMVSAFLPWLLKALGQRGKSTSLEQIQLNLLNDV